MSVGLFPKRVHKSNPHLLQYCQLSRVVNILRSAKRRRDRRSIW